MKTSTMRRETTPQRPQRATTDAPPWDAFHPRWLGPHPQAGDAGVVVVHGFTGSVWDVLPQAEALADAGHPVVVPCLHGHDRGPGGIQGARLHDWRRDVRAPAEALYEATGRPILVVGLSMGSLLAIDLALSGAVPIAGLALLASPLAIGRLSSAVAALSVSPRTPWAASVHWPKLGGSDISNRAPTPGARATPLRAAHELFQLRDHVRAGLGRLTVPLLVVHGRQDHTAPVAGAYELAHAAVAAPSLRLVVLDEGWHVITRDVSAARVTLEVLAFAARVAPAR